MTISDSRPPLEVQLRDVQPDDLPIFFEHQLDLEAIAMAAFPARDRDTFNSHWNRVLDDESVTVKAILANGQVAGHIVCFEQEGRPEVGYWIGRSNWGKGVATSALAEFLGHVTERPLFAHVATHNLASMRVLEKCGFVRVGESSYTNPAGDDVKEYLMELGSRGRVALQ